MISIQYICPYIRGGAVFCGLLVCSSFDCIRGRRQPAGCVAFPARRATQRTSSGNRGGPWPPVTSQSRPCDVRAAGRERPGHPGRAGYACRAGARLNLAVACSMRHPPRRGRTQSPTRPDLVPAPCTPRAAST